jgi:hypothetical protein
MTVGRRTDVTKSRLYRSGWLIVLCAVTSYMLIAFAEQGSAGTGIRGVPNDPLPFERHSGIGIDLSAMSSLGALEWLEQADTTAIPMILIPVDGDIVSAMNSPETYTAARTALDQLIDAARPAPLTLCLQRPITALEESLLAEAMITVIIESYTDRVTYISTCSQGTSPSWQDNVLELLGTETSSSTSEHILAPVSVGAPVRLMEPLGLETMTRDYLDRLSGDRYVATRFMSDPVVTADQRRTIQNVLHDRSQVALVLAVPHPEADPITFTGSLRFSEMPHGELSEGYNNVSSPQISWNGDWTPTPVGPVLYHRTTQTGSWFTAEFVGTEVWVVGLVSPDGGRLGIWINADDPQTIGDPDRVVSLARTQATDTSILVMDGLPAARHRMTVVAADGEVALAALFVTGRPDTGWHGELGAIGIIVLAIAGVAVVLTVAVDDLRTRIGLDGTDGEEVQHPRVFRRDL